MPRIRDEALSGRVLLAGWRRRVAGSQGSEDEVERLANVLASARADVVKLLLPVPGLLWQAVEGEVVWPGYASDLDGIDLAAVVREAEELVIARAAEFALALRQGGELPELAVPPAPSRFPGRSVQRRAYSGPDGHELRLRWEDLLYGSPFSSTERVVLIDALAAAEVDEIEARLPLETVALAQSWCEVLWIGEPAELDQVAMDEVMADAHGCVFRRAFGDGRNPQARLDELLKTLRAR
jgi:hypothetical protein